MAGILYKIPASSNFKKLTSEHALTLKAHFKRARDERAQICLIAESIRRAHLSQNGGRDVYSVEFNAWYEQNKLDIVFGHKSNFTKYAQVGSRVYSFIANELAAPEAKRTEFLNNLPLSISALYEISTLINSADIKSKSVELVGHPSGWDELRIALTSSMSRKSIDEPIGTSSAASKPLINPHVSAAQIISWKNNWRRPPQKVTRTTKTTVPLAVIYANGELYDFDRKTGEKIGRLDLVDVQRKLQQLQKIFTQAELKNELFRIEDDLTWIEEGYSIRQWAVDQARAFEDRPERTISKRLVVSRVPLKAVKKKPAKKATAKKTKGAAAFVAKPVARKKPAAKKNAKKRTTR